MHEDIKTFSLEGELKDSNLVKIKETLIRELESMMRDNGYAPVLDIEEQFTLDYEGDREIFKFRLTMYGVPVEGNAWRVAGTMHGKQIMRYIMKPKSSQSLMSAE